MDFYDIEGHGDLARDPRTNTIINVNDHDYHHYDDKNYWTGVDIDHSLSSESSVN